MTIKRNSAKCKHCDEEIESKYTHDFKGHYCKVKPRPDGSANFFVDGGKEYLRRVGDFDDMIETSEES